MNYFLAGSDAWVATALPAAPFRNA
ncbi:MAG: hypothetical protein RIT26_2280, partial [Pseudomonadota bacterium]